MLALVVHMSFRPQSELCDPNYYKFLRTFKKPYSSSGMAEFCKNFENYLTYNESCEFCEVTELFDQDFNTFIEPDFDQEEKLATYTCEQVRCFADNPLDTIRDLPNNVDHRINGLTTLAKNEKKCGSCWAMSLSYLLENSILLEQKSIDIASFRKNAKQLDISVTYLLRNIFGFEQYCKGGDGVLALNYMTDNNFSTIELASNFPYKYDEYEYWVAKATLTPLLDQSEYFIPYELFERINVTNVIGTQITPVIRLADASYFNADVIMSYLARGISVLGAMLTTTEPDSHAKFSSYSGKLPIEGIGCSRVGSANHQIQFIGYGTFKSVDVWLVKNSYGRNWGSEGSFYIKRGRNDYCIENYAYAVIPKYYDKNAGVFGENYTSAYEDIKRGYLGFDKDDGTYYKVREKKSVYFFVFCVILGVVAISMIVLGLFCICKSRQQRIRAQYKLTDQVRF